MGEDKKKRRMKVGWVLFVILKLALDAIPGIIESMDFINPEGFLVEGVKSQCESYENANTKNKNFLLFDLIQRLKFDFHNGRDLHSEYLIALFEGDLRNYGRFPIDFYSIARVLFSQYCRGLPPLKCHSIGHTNSIFPCRLGIPKKKLYRSISWKPVKIEEASIKISLRVKERVHGRAIRRESNLERK